jgi:hypothetical protein
VLYIQLIAFMRKVINYTIKGQVFGSPMYELEVTVTTYTLEELKLTADWPLIWLQAPGSIEILHKLPRNEIVPPLNEPVKRSEFPVNQSLRLDFQIGDRLLARCFLKGESLE